MTLLTKIDSYDPEKVDSPRRWIMGIAAMIVLQRKSRSTYKSTRGEGVAEITGQMAQIHDRGTRLSQKILKNELAIALAELVPS